MVGVLEGAGNLVAGRSHPVVASIAPTTACPAFGGNKPAPVKFDVHTYVHSRGKWTATGTVTVGETVRFNAVFQSRDWTSPSSYATVILYRPDNKVAGDGIELVSWPMSQRGDHRGSCWRALRFSATTTIPRGTAGKMVVEVLVDRAPPGAFEVGHTFLLTIKPGKT